MVGVCVNRIGTVDSFRKRLRRLPCSERGVLFTSSFPCIVHEPQRQCWTGTPSWQDDQTPGSVLRAPQGFVSLRWDKKRHPSRLRASAAVGGRSGWCTGGRLPIVIDRRGGCRVPLPAPDLHLRLRGYIFRREATSALRSILSERPAVPSIRQASAGLMPGSH